jgi:hypothetical protein
VTNVLRNNVMKVLVLDATGGTGREVVREAGRGGMLWQPSSGRQRAHRIYRVLIWWQETPVMKRPCPGHVKGARV